MGSSGYEANRKEGIGGIGRRFANVACEEDIIWAQGGKCFACSTDALCR